VSRDATPDQSVQRGSTDTAEALGRGEASLRLALEAGQMGTWEWDIRTGEIQWSENLERLHGLPPGSFGRNFEAYKALIHPDDSDGVLAAIRGCLEGGDDYEAEFRGADTSKGVRWMLGRGRLLTDERGQPRRMIGVCMDVTKRKSAEEALLQANHRKDEFLAMVSHELRNPLNAILNASTVLSHATGGNPISSKALVAIERQTAQLVRIVNELLDVSRGTANKLNLESVSLDLGSVVERSVQDFAARHLLDRHRYEVHCLATPVLGDGPRLEQVVSNLLTNAIKYTPPGGQIRLNVAREGNDAVLRVSDDGMGIAPELLPRIFDLFVQSEAGVERRDGLGLGLAIVRRLVEAHGGRVEAHSTGPGAGTEIVVRLPSAEPLAERVDARSRRRILIIDDNTDTREAVAALLEIAGHEVYQAAEAAGALESAARLRPDVAILDIGLPGLDGFELARRLGALAPCPRLIALTGHGQADHRRLGEEVGFEAYLVKPVGLEALLRTVANR
jgi:PAS domain S-box-containing protein